MANTNEASYNILGDGKDKLASADQAAVSTSSPKAISGGYGFATTAQMTAIITLVNRLRADLVTLKAIKGSA